MIFEREASAFAGEREYLFASPTVREVSYESISEQERREIHDRVAAWLMARSDEEAGEHLGLIADHLERRGRWSRRSLICSGPGNRRRSSSPTPRRWPTLAAPSTDTGR